MMFVADECVPDPVIRSLQEVKFDIVDISQIQKEKPDYSVLQTCLEKKSPLITLDTGIPSQAYAFEYAENGVSVILFRWKMQGHIAWQQMVECILRDHNQWENIIQKETSVISVNYRGSRSHAWSKISSHITGHALKKEQPPPTAIFGQPPVKRKRKRPDDPDIGQKSLI